MSCSSSPPAPPSPFHAASPHILTEARSGPTIALSAQGRARERERKREEQRDGADRRGERENRSREAVLVRL